MKCSICNETLTNRDYYVSSYAHTRCVEACPTSAGSSAPERADEGQRAEEVQPVPATSLVGSAPVSGPAMLTVMRRFEELQAEAKKDKDYYVGIGSYGHAARYQVEEACWRRALEIIDAASQDAGPAAGQRAQARNDEADTRRKNL